MLGSRHLSGPKSSGVLQCSAFTCQHLQCGGQWCAAALRVRLSKEPVGMGERGAGDTVLALTSAV